MSNRAHNYLRLAAEAIQNDQAVTVQETVPVMMSDQEDELQLHEEEGTPKSSRKKRNYDGETKLEAVKWARDKKSSRSGNANIISAAKKFNVTRSRIQEWVKQEAVIKQQVNSPGGSKRKRLEGGGRNVSFPELDAQLAVWIREKRELKQPVSRKARGI